MSLDDLHESRGFGTVLGIRHLSQLIQRMDVIFLISQC